MRPARRRTRIPATPCPRRRPKRDRMSILTRRTGPRPARRGVRMRVTPGAAAAAATRMRGIARPTRGSRRLPMPATGCPAVAALLRRMRDIGVRRPPRILMRRTRLNLTGPRPTLTPGIRCRHGRKRNRPTRMRAIGCRRSPRSRTRMPAARCQRSRPIRMPVMRRRRSLIRPTRTLAMPRRPRPRNRIRTPATPPRRSPPIPMPGIGCRRRANRRRLRSRRRRPGP